GRLRPAHRRGAGPAARSGRAPHDLPGEEPRGPPSTARPRRRAPVSASARAQASTVTSAPSVARRLEQGAARSLEEALALTQTLHLPGRRDLYRSLLDDAIA